MSEKQFDPSSMASTDSGIFGLPHGSNDAKLHLLTVPWETTTSYGNGAALGPEAILRASHQVDLFDYDTGEAWRVGYYAEPISELWMKKGQELKVKSQQRLNDLEANRETPQSNKILAEINAVSNELNSWVKKESLEKLNAGKIVGLIGGDHSTPFGLIGAIAERTNGDFGVLHIDAHADLRAAYQGYEFSHASIMYNVTEKIKPRTIVQMGIRDFSRDEKLYSDAHSRASGEIGSTQIKTFYDRAFKQRLQNGECFSKVIDSAIAFLPQNVYISFDIDGLDPSLCPNTGTPVPGGFTFDEASSLIAAVARSGRKIVGFDLNEVAEPAPGEGEWDANVGARLLFRLCGWTVISQGLAEAP